MRTKTSIEWTDYSWNPVSGCDKVSPGIRLVGAENAAREESKGHLIRTWKRTSTAIPAHVCEVSAA